MTTIPSENDDIEQQLKAFLQGSDALMLATVNGQGHPEASYAPYVEHDGCYFILISGLASHTKNLKQSSVASVMFVDDKHEGHAHTRRRLSCHCKAKSIQRDDALFEPVVQRMLRQFGKLITTLRSLGDFQLFQLKPIKGNFVTGFGKAFVVDFFPEAKIRHRRPD